MQREQELLDAENEVERATLKAHILEEEDDLEEFSVPSQACEDGLSVTAEKSPAPSSVFDNPPPLAVSAKKGDDFNGYTGRTCYFKSCCS